MAIQIVIGNHAKFKVEGTIKDEKGADVPFSFHLKCRRLPADDIAAAIDAVDGNFVEFLVSVVEDWDDVKNAEKQPIPYAESELRELCKLPGLARLAFNAYVTNVGAKAKN